MRGGYENETRSLSTDCTWFGSLGVHAIDADWGALAESMARAHPMGLMQMNF